MYSPQLQEYVQGISQQVQVEVSQVHLLEESMACFVSAIGRLLDARTEPEGDLLSTTVRLLLISDGLSRLEADNNVDGIHYLVGLGFEQLTALITRLQTETAFRQSRPLDSDLWYGLSLSLLHYLAGGHRVQALSVLRNLQRISDIVDDGENSTSYRRSSEAFRRLYSGKALEASLGRVDTWDELLLGQRPAEGVQEERLQRLAQKIRSRRDVLLAALGEDQELAWLATRGIGTDSTEFWKEYLIGLNERGITTFTNEQVGEQGFDGWLQPDKDLLVILPTGAGKTIIAELRTALALTQNKKVLWLLPTRALVRQTQKTLQEAFERVGVVVEELPTTEDFIPLFTDWSEQVRHIAVSTPERIDALLRAKPECVDDIGLVVVDEAQILLDEGRGVTTELVLQKIRSSRSECNVVLMSAFWEFKDAFLEFLERLLGKKPFELVSERRPTRRIYGVLTNASHNGRQYPISLLYPPGLQGEAGSTSKPFKIVFDQMRLNFKPATLDIARSVVKKSTAAKLRTAVFVYQVRSTEKQAEMIAKTLEQEVPLPEKDLLRLRYELGRESIVQKTGKQGVVPHHAGLTPLEQTIAEKWVHDGRVSTVCATQTLAQGVNLPFDVSIVTFTKRHHTKEDVPLQEIRNMLGRAGRAGYVSDGVALIVVPTSGNPLATLDRSRSYFFKQLQPSREHLGLAKLARDSILAHVDNADWLYEMGGMDFSAAQALVHFIVNTRQADASQSESLAAHLTKFPSIQNLSSAELSEARRVLVQLGENLEELLSKSSSQSLRNALKRTGMPIEVLRFFLERVRADHQEMEQAPETLQIDWADRAVVEVLELCKHREWYSRLSGRPSWKQVSPSHLHDLVALWRSGVTVVGFEQAWMRIQGQSALSEKVHYPDSTTRIDCGRFRRDLSLIAQFWGAFAVCYEIERGADQDNNLKNLLVKTPALIREGVSSVEQLEWLYAIGGVDRVLAIELSKKWRDNEGSPIEGRELRRLVRRWRSRKSSLPGWLDEQSTHALKGVLGL